MSKYTKKKGIRIKKIKKKNKIIKKVYQIKYNDQLNILKKHIIINYPFYIVSSICIYFLSCKPSNKKSFLNMMSSFIFIAYSGFFIHMISHNIHYTSMYNNYPVIYKNIPIIDVYIRNFTWFLDFHHETHHDTEINKQFKNQFLEGVNNFVMQGAIGVIAGTLYNMLDWRMFLFWGIFYASFHIINYTYLEPTVHSDHHTNIYSNYGIDIFDILMGTKNNWNDIEDYNHFSINMIILTTIIYFII